MRLLSRRLAVPCLAALCSAAAVPAATTATAATAAAAGEPQKAPPLLDTIELWLAANFDLPPSVEAPALVSVPATELVAMRYGSGATVPPGPGRCRL